MKGGKKEKNGRLSNGSGVAKQGETRGKKKKDSTGNPYG